MSEPRELECDLSPRARQTRIKIVEHQTSNGSRDYTGFMEIVCRGLKNLEHFQIQGLGLEASGSGLPGDTTEARKTWRMLKPQQRESRRHAIYGGVPRNRNAFLGVSGVRIITHCGLYVVYSVSPILWKLPFVFA